MYSTIRLHHPPLKLRVQQNAKRRHSIGESQGSSSTDTQVAMDVPNSLAIHYLTPLEALQLLIPCSYDAHHCTHPSNREVGAQRKSSAHVTPGSDAKEGRMLDALG
jgi:hypothetical protein